MTIVMSSPDWGNISGAVLTFNGVNYEQALTDRFIVNDVIDGTIVIRSVHPNYSLYSNSLTVSGAELLQMPVYYD